MTDPGAEQLLAWVRQGIDFDVIRDVDFDAATGRLAFQVAGDDGALPRVMMLAPASRRDFDRLGGQDRGTLDVRGQDGQGHLRVVVDGQRGPGRWHRGIAISLAGDGALHDTIPDQRRLADLGMQSAMVGHELKQPLFAIGMAAKSIELMVEQQQKGGADRLEAMAQAVGRIRGQIDRAQQIMTGIIEAVRPAPAGARGCDMRDAVTHVLASLQPLLDQHRVVVTLVLPDGPLPVLIRQIMLEQVLVNAIRNALDSLRGARARGRDAGLLTLSVERGEGGIACRIIDDGEGLGAGGGDDAFRPFFTTKPEQDSMGLGLHVSRQIVEKAGGTVDLTQNAGHGATLSFTLPRARRSDDLRDV
jgi:signal transduction histidine kinase